MVIPTHNRCASLRRCLEHLFRCDGRQLAVTIHVVDDGSTDGTPALLEELAAATPEWARLVVHRQQQAGPGAARNVAIRVAETEWVLFLDDDCAPTPGWLQALATPEWDGDVGAVGGRIRSPDSGNMVARYCRLVRYNEFPEREGPITFVNTANAAYRREALLRIGLMEPSVSGGGEAQDLSWRIRGAGFRLEYAPEALVLHYHRESIPLLARTYWVRGYRSTLRRIQWGELPPPSWLSSAAAICRLGLSVAGVALFPVRLLRFLRRRASLADAAGFALLYWLTRVARHAGACALLCRVQVDTQLLHRTTGLAGPLPAPPTGGGRTPEPGR